MDATLVLITSLSLLTIGLNHLVLRLLWHEVRTLRRQVAALHLHAAGDDVARLAVRRGEP